MRLIFVLLASAEWWFAAESLATAALESVSEKVAHRHRHRHHHRKHHHYDATGEVSRQVGEEQGNTGVDSHRPIITGCLKECGYDDQSCATTCQVCAEQQECRDVHDEECAPCLREARTSKVRQMKTDKNIIDAGGIAMMRDGLLAEMTRAKLEAVDRKRKLRIAREDVLQAQREQEWAKEERSNAAARLKAKREELKKQRKEVTKWDLENEKKLKKMRTQARENRQEKRKAEQKLEEAEAKYGKARKKLRIASNESIADGEEVWKAKQEVDRRQKAVEEAERELETTEEDGEWLDRGLRQRVKRAQRTAKDAREKLLEGRSRGRVAQGKLEAAKTCYLDAVLASQEADRAATEAEAKLRGAPTVPSTSMSPQSNATGHVHKFEDHATPTRSGVATRCLSFLTVLVSLLSLAN